MRSLVCCPLCICESYLVSRLLSVADTLVQRSKMLVQRCKHACAAFQNACAALHTRLFSVANPLVQRYRTLVQRCRRLRSAPHLHSLLTSTLTCTCMSPPPPPCYHWDSLPPRRQSCSTPNDQHNLSVCRLSAFHVNAQWAKRHLVTIPWVSLTFGAF